MELDPETGRPVQGSVRVYRNSTCWIQLWLLHQYDDVAGARTVLEATESADRSRAKYCIVLAAALEARESPGGPTPHFERFDSMMTAGGGCGEENLFLADWWASRGDSARSLQALRQRRFRNRFVCGPGRYLPEFLVREGRLAATLGDTAVAIEAYDLYLKLRTHPDPGPLTEERDEVRRALAELKR